MVTNILTPADDFNFDFRNITVIICKHNNKKRFALEIFYNDQGCGSGKTYESLKAIVEKGGKHLFAVERRDAIAERHKEFCLHMAAAERDIHIETIMSGDGAARKNASVRDQVEAAADKLSLMTNCIILLTHEALRLADLSTFAARGWCLWIDEMPNALDHDSHNAEASWRLFEQFYELEDTDERWRKVTLKADVPSAGAVGRDDALKTFHGFHQRVADDRREVFVDVKAWKDLSVPAAKLNWFSLWPPTDFEHFEGVFLLANAAPRLATARIWQQQFPAIKWTQFGSGARQAKHRDVYIRYYADAHVAARAHFNSDIGRGHLAQIDADPWGSDGNHIWTCNHADIHAFARQCGQYLTPRQSGSNDYAWASWVSAIYSAKASPQVRSIYKRLGVAPAAFTRSAELETILQFVWRSALRDANDDRPVFIRVYDRQQAEFLKEEFEADPRGHLSVSLECRDLGFATYPRKTKTGPVKKDLTAAQYEQKKADRRAKNAEVKRRSRAKAKEAKALKLARKT